MPDPEEKYKQTPLERNIGVLLYLKKFDGTWKNTREIATGSTEHSLGRGRLDETLDGLVQRGLILKRNAENPQAKWEYKINDKGKTILATYLSLLNDPDMKFVAGVRRKKFDESDPV